MVSCPEPGFSSLLTGDGPAPDSTKVSRFSDVRIVPIEVGRVIIDRRPVGFWVRHDKQTSKLEKFVSMLHKGEVNIPGLSGVTAGFSAVFATGGAVERPFPTSGIVTWLSDDTGKNAALDGPYNWLRRKGFVRPLVCDLGQTSLKVLAGKRRWRFPRNFNFVPIGGTVEDGRRAIREWVTGKLSAALSYCEEPPDAVFFGLPCPVGPDALPGPCSYTGLASDAEFLPDVLRGLVVSNAPTWCSNDAEAAAIGALDLPSAAEHRRLLVLTLGFALGAALINH